MKNRNILTIVSLFCTFISGAACNVATETVPAPQSVQNTTATIPLNESPLPASPSATSPPTATATLVLISSLTASPIAPTPTSAPFVPANLVPISPQNVAELQPVAELAEQGAGVVAFSPDSQRLAAGLFTSNHIKVWDLTSGRERFDLDGHADPRIISYLSFSPDGSRLASAAQGWDAQNDSLILWDAEAGRELQRFSGVLGAISPDWRLAALTQREQEQDVTLVLSELASGEEILTLQAPSDIYGVSFSPDGQRVAAKMFHVFQDLFAFWSVDSGRLDLTLYNWLGFSFSPDRRFIAALVDSGSGSDKGELNIYDAVTFKWIKTLAKDADALWYSYPAFSPDGQILAASVDDQVVFWDTQTWKKLASLPVSGPSGFSFSPDGRILTTNTLRGMLQLWGVVEAR
jgi:WD40 repeat protein